MSLINHAKLELALVKEDQEIIDEYLKIIQIFVDMGHSGYSGMHFISVLNALLNFNNLTPLTDDPSEWNFIAEDVWGSLGGIWQSNRNSEAFSNDLGKTYYFLSEGANDKHREPLHKSVHKETNT